MSTPEDGHSWYSVDDVGGKTTWIFDTTFLRSRYRCIYGQGCPSIDSEPDPTATLGCCIHGAHMVDKEDRGNVLAFADRLGPEVWQNRDRAEAKGGPLKKKKGGDWVTRKVDGACIFLNRDGFDGGAGCALHLGAEQAGARPMDWKPDVCWQVPLHLDVHTDEYGHETVILRAWQRRDWGPGGEDFHWWCIEDQATTHIDDQPVYVTLADELIEMVGRKVYQRLKDHLDTLADVRSVDPDGIPITATPVALS